MGDHRGVTLVTGSAGLIGAETCRRFHDDLGHDVVGIDNDLRSWFFGAAASTAAVRRRLEETLDRYAHHDVDIRDATALDAIVAECGSDLAVVVHTAAQPSHDWAASDPATDFAVNATGTLNLLESCRRHTPNAVVIFTSTNKVYGDTPNTLPLVDEGRRWEVAPDHPFRKHGIDETMSLDHSRHSLFGVSKAAADLMVQEYGRYFGMHTVCFRGGCLTGPDHAGAELHGFLAYLMACTVRGDPYTVYGYEGKQVRDNIHAHDLVSAFLAFAARPAVGKVYNLGGGRHSNCSMLEAIDRCEELTGKKLDWHYDPTNRIGDHQWWISDVRRFQRDYPEWSYEYDLDRLLEEIHDRSASSAGPAS